MRVILLVCALSASLACDVTQTGPTVVVVPPQVTPADTPAFDPCWLYVGPRRELCDAMKPKL